MSLVDGLRERREYHAADEIEELREERDALAERAEKLESALRAAVECIKVWHAADDVWQIYYENAPEMKPIREALARPSTPPTDVAI